MEEAVNAAAISPDHILKELANLWVSLGKQGQDEGGAGVLRACTMTLLVLAEESDDPSALGETLAALMPEHPARTIMVRLRGPGERALAERVYAQCWMPFGQRRQICCEQIEIMASDLALPDLPGVVLPLAAPDLPTIAWLRSARLAQMPEFRSIARMADKMVVDSAGFANPVDALWQLADSSRRGMTLGDLAWTRLTRWREALARVFENREYAAKAVELSAVRVEFGEGWQTSAWYLASWVAAALESVGAKAKLSLVRGEAPSLRLELAGANFRVELARAGERLSVTVNDLVNTTNLPQPSDYLAMREELAIVQRDAVFERTLASAARLAYATNK
jgi:glucose-6-phosphate dehydrogenase assembly protein OpcA